VRAPEKSAEAVVVMIRFCLTQEGLLITASAKSLDRFKARVRELWDARRRGTTEELKEEWQSYLRGWWNYYRLAEWRRPIFSVGWCGRVHGRNPVHSTRSKLARISHNLADRLTAL
jgi:hypothetical protein